MQLIKVLLATSTTFVIAVPTLDSRHPTCGTVLNVLSKSKDPFQVMRLGKGECVPLLDKNVAESYWSKNGCTCSLYKSKDCAGEPIVYAAGPKQSPISDVRSYACIATVGGPLDVMNQ